MFARVNRLIDWIITERGRNTLTHRPLIDRVTSVCPRVVRYDMVMQVTPIRSAAAAKFPVRYVDE